MKELKLWPLDEARVDGVAAFRAPVTALDGIRFVESQSASSVGSAKIGLLGWSRTRHPTES